MAKYNGSARGRFKRQIETQVFDTSHPIDAEVVDTTKPGEVVTTKTPVQDVMPANSGEAGKIEFLVPSGDCEPGGKRRRSRAYRIVDFAARDAEEVRSKDAKRE